MIMSSKVYAVIEYGGEYEDSWENIIGICSTSEIADELKAKVESAYSKTPTISEEEWDNICIEIDRWEEEHEIFDSTIDAIKFLFPDKYSDKDIQEAIDKYDHYDDFSGILVKEVPYFTDINQIN